MLRLSRPIHVARRFGGVSARITHVAITILATTLLSHGRAAAICADGIINRTEQCDDGGICIGGPLAGSACTSEAQCLSGGACFGGPDDLRACNSDDDCRMAPCTRCRPIGGDGCAANCSHETEITVDLIDGGRVVDEVELGTSGAVLQGCCLTIPLPSWSSVRLIAGRSVDGLMPIVVPTGGFALDRIPLSIACACVRMPSSSTCGGTLTEMDGKLSLNCTAGFPEASACPPDRPCAALHGAGNAGSGFVGCGAHAIGATVSHDCNGIPNQNPYAAVLTTATVDGPENPDQGNALLALTTAISIVIGQCRGSEAAYGADGEFCTDDDPVAARGLPRSSQFTTGSAVGTVLNSIPDFPDYPIGPLETAGRGFACSPDGSVDIGDGVITSVFSICGSAIINPGPSNIEDYVVPISFALGPAPSLPGALAAPCTGDCDRQGEVTVDELTKVVSIALGTDSLEQCSVGDLDESADITVDEVTAAVTFALGGCAGEQESGGRPM